MYCRGLVYVLLSSLVSGSLVSESAHAQQPAAPKPAGPKTLVGIVTDTLGNPVDSVELVISSVKRHAMSASDGTFRFDDIKPGPYQVLARRLGYYPQVQSATVDEKGGVVSFSILQGFRALPPVVVSVGRGGLSGVIGDTAYNIVEGAQIAVIASDHRVASDSMGRFFLDLKPGKYMVNVTRPGYRSRLVSVTIPNDSGRRMTVWLTPANRGQTARDGFAYDALALRLETRSPVFSNIFTREDINRLGIQDGYQLARLGSNSQLGPPDDRCEAIIDGGPRTLPLWAIDAADIEAMETYAPSPKRGTVTSINRNRPISTQSGSNAQAACKGVRVYVWLRK
jgi:hypothetical protein